MLAASAYPAVVGTIVNVPLLLHSGTRPVTFQVPEIVPSLTVP